MHGTGTAINKGQRAGVGRLISVAAFLSCPFGVSHAQAPDQSMLEEIVDTGQRREENIQDLPISVSVLRRVRGYKNAARACR